MAHNIHIIKLGQIAIVHHGSPTTAEAIPLRGRRLHPYNVMKKSMAVILRSILQNAHPLLATRRLLTISLLLVLVSSSILSYLLTHTTHHSAAPLVSTVHSVKPNTLPPQVARSQTPPSKLVITPLPPIVTKTPIAVSPVAQAPLPLPSLPIVTGKNTSYNLGILVIKYFPLTTNGQNIDIAVTGDVGDSYATIRQRTSNITNNLVSYLSKATQYLGYKYSGNSPAMTFHIVDTIEHNVAVPINATLHTGHPTYADYPTIMSSHNICNYVDNLGVHEVFLWAYQGPTKPGTSQPYLDIAESKMSGPYGDISNSYRWNDMPVCQHTYMVYTFNYQRGTAEAMHSWGHQIESEIKAVDNNLFSLFQGPIHPQADMLIGRCGSVHNPPNSRQEYDYANSTAQQSDCEDWQPDSQGSLTSISCAVWGCADVSDANNAQLNYMVWMWQHLPGRNNTKMYHGAQLRNWWDVHGNFDTIMGNNKRLTL
jgi:hypothetical protein